jgi:hypothetical protein
MAASAVDMEVTPAGPGGEGSSSSGAGPSSRRPKRFEIKKWNAVALWAWGESVQHVTSREVLSRFVSPIFLCWGRLKVYRRLWRQALVLVYYSKEVLKS